MTNLMRYITLFLVVSVSAATLAQDTLTLRFCFEDKQLLPYYAGKGTQVATPPGGTIEHLQAAIATIPSLELTLQRKPWLRCLQLLEQNRIDAIVASFTESRLHFAVYPMRAEGEPDPNRALSDHASCLVQRKGDDVIGRAAEGLVYARPLGYAMPRYPDEVSILPVESQQKAFELVRQGRVDATTTLCLVNQKLVPVGFSNGLEIVYPPLYQATGYLVFSKAFFKAHTQLALALWLELPKHRNASHYLSYLEQEKY